MDEHQRTLEKIDLYYFTDPLCSHCWALDTVLTRFKLEYHTLLDVHTIMGALVEDDNHYKDLKGPEAKEMVDHWDQVSRFYHVPMNTRIWHIDPITSSYPSSIAYLYLKDHIEAKAGKFLRLVREGAFLFEKNIAKRSILEQILRQLEIDPDPVLDFAYSDAGKEMLIKNMAPIDLFSVNGFPTVVLVNKNQEAVKVVGSRTLETYKKALRKVLPDATELQPTPIPPLDHMLDILPTLFDSDIEKLYDVAPDKSKKIIKQQTKGIPLITGMISGNRFIQKQ